MAFATETKGDLTTFVPPSSSRGQMIVPPPTSAMGNEPAWVFTLLIMSSNFLASKSCPEDTVTGSSVTGIVPTPGASPAATAISVVVRTLPPKQSASVVNLLPTLSGPMLITTPSGVVLRTDPPPSPMLETSGMGALIWTWAILLYAEACRGYPVAIKTPASVVVPPTSRTIMLSLFSSSLRDPSLVDLSTAR